MVIDRATDLDGDGLSDGFLNVRDVPVGSLTVTVEGGDPEFALDPAEVDPFFLAAGESATFDDLPAGFYALTMTDLEDDLVLDAIDCGGDEIDRTNRTVHFALTGGDAVACTFTVSERDDADPYDIYDDDPGDPDFDFDTPFDDAGDPGSPPAGDAGAGIGATRQPQPTGDHLAVAGVAAAAPGPAAEQAPDVLNELPRTGAAVGPPTMVGGLLVSLGGLGMAARPRRRYPHRI